MHCRPSDIDSTLPYRHSTRVLTVYRLNSWKNGLISLCMGLHHQSYIQRKEWNWNSLQFSVISISKTYVLLSRVLGKNWHFWSMGLQGAPLCACCFCAGISMSCIEAPCRPIDKKCNFFSCTWFHKFRDFTVQWWVWTANDHSKCA